MSAAKLREAAALMRSRAGAATDGPWGVASVGGQGFAVHRGEHTTVSLFSARYDADHIASWHPAVALAVADWLESVAGAMTPPGEDVPAAGRHINSRDEAHALAVATAYLGGDQ